MNGLTPRPDWLLLAPWFRWPQQGVTAGGVKVRDTWPAIQKYATSDPAGDFVKEPQRSLKFMNDEDFFQYTVALPALPKLPGALAGVKRRLSDSRLVTTTTKKLFQDSHHRMYLVVVQLVRDEAGFPCVNRDGVCQMGFVVRRRRLATLRPIDRVVGSIMRDVYVQAWRQQQVRTFLKQLESTGTDVPGETLVALDQAEAMTAGALAQERLRLATWAQAAQAKYVVEGWKPSGHPDIGRWDKVAAAPQVLEEKTYPLYAMAPDPEDREHDAYNASLYFGLIPTGGSDVEDDGTARFEHDELYEVRCFVRRHDVRCPKTDRKAPDCQGPLTWSAASEPYFLAAPMDVVGTSNHVVTIHAPDLQALSAQSASLGKVTAPVRVVSPKGSALQFTQAFGEFPAKGGVDANAAAEICFFMIPVFTIVALFLFNLFLPILMLIFQLWWMLALKLCIPPSASLAGNVTAEIDALGAMGIQLDANLAATAELTLDGQFTAKGKDNQAFRSSTLLPNLKKDLGDSAGAQVVGAYSTDALVRLHQSLSAAAEAAANRTLSSRLVFEDKVTRSQAVLV